jgi:hypothetical protein
MLRDGAARLPGPVGLAILGSLAAFGCGPPHTVVQVYPWPDTAWTGVLYYRATEPDPEKIANPDALEKAGRACNGSFRIVSGKRAKVGPWVYAYGIPVQQPEDGTVMVFECLDPALTMQRCERYDGMRRSGCFERMKKAPVRAGVEP